MNESDRILFDVHPAYKEAVANSLLNGLSNKLCGKGDLYKIIYGAKPSQFLMSGFILPKPPSIGGSNDIENDPIHIHCHGLDFQIFSASENEEITVRLTGCIYVRIFPSKADVEKNNTQEGKVDPGEMDYEMERADPPMKWLRLMLDLPSFSFTPKDAESDAKKATYYLNSAIHEQLLKWQKSSDKEIGGQYWGYRKNCEIEPSDRVNWSNYLEKMRQSKNIVVPKIELRWIIRARKNVMNKDVLDIHLSLENDTLTPQKGDFRIIEASLFQVSISVTFPSRIHKDLTLDRIAASYRYDQYLKYPALGFNSGVECYENGSSCTLTTTWMPKYNLPKIVPRATETERNIAKLAQPDAISDLKPLTREYSAWLSNIKENPLDYCQRETDQDALFDDIKKWEAESKAIERGIAILERSKKFWKSGGAQESPLGIPFEAWLAMNSTMAEVAKLKNYSDWHLFQLAFILSSISDFVIRLPEFHEFYSDTEAVQHAESTTLLYFPTGGGKSEAFLGLLVFVLFFDRLRGKSCGVSAFMRYPLRLLTLQQAQRAFLVLGVAEKIRYDRRIPGDPFSLGFWVGKSNTPNWHRDEHYKNVPSDDKVKPIEEHSYIKNHPDYEKIRRYWLKLSNCPFCSSNNEYSLALRRHSEHSSNTLGHYCTNPRCSWNKRFDRPMPLPFYIVDEDIYDLAPSVLLSTVDKLAAIGQSQGTIRKFFGMFGFAPFLNNKNKRLFIPATVKDWNKNTNIRLFPSFKGGEKRFFDPFPSLLIQDEAHLLTESLGSFSGLFETALEAGFDALSPLLGEQLSLSPNRKNYPKIKIIVASATVSQPEKQMNDLYQRTSLVQFPYPSPQLYYSFYSNPMLPFGDEDHERIGMSLQEIESKNHWSRIYAAILTNNHSHAEAASSILSNYHLIITDFFKLLQSNDQDKQEEARQKLIQWIACPQPLSLQFKRLLEKISSSLLLALIDLHRISLTYVGSKKLGDQILDSERREFKKTHQLFGHQNEELLSELISGSVLVSDLQDIIKRAQEKIPINSSSSVLSKTLRSIVATSAISHGVDVNELNTIFFIGIPSNIAEYIQASSRVGRVHVGLSIVIPSPHRDRDRFVFEIHDIFHRFLERMVMPAPIDRWAEKAVIRSMPSFFQEYICGIHPITQICIQVDEKKCCVSNFSRPLDVRRFLAESDNFENIEIFITKALGLNAAESIESKNHYLEIVNKEINDYRQKLESNKLANTSTLNKFFEERNSACQPMTSLRDVDRLGIIRESKHDASYKRAPDGMTKVVMSLIRHGCVASEIENSVERSFDEERSSSKSEIMKRSHNQIATIYAPESFFTFEGGWEGCIIHPSDRLDSAELSSSQKNLIFERMESLSEAWLKAGKTIKNDGDESVWLDSAMLASNKTFQFPGSDRFCICKPSFAEYTIAPLTFVCKKCGLFRGYDTLYQLQKDLQNLNSIACQGRNDGKPCNWEQLDVILVDYTGYWEGISPNHWYWNSEKQTTQRTYHKCGCLNFRLDRNDFNPKKWKFQCMKCNEIISIDRRFSEASIKSYVGKNESKERIPMRVLKYRASNVYYPQTELFISFENDPDGLLDKLHPKNVEDLKIYVAKKYNLLDPVLEDEIIKKTIAGNLKLVGEYSTLKELEKISKRLGAVELYATAKANFLKTIKFDSGAIQSNSSWEDIYKNIENSHVNFARQFNPFRLLIEHDLLKNNFFQEKSGDFNNYVSFSELDNKFSLDDTYKKNQELETRRLLKTLKIADMGLIREFDLCRFSYGYSRLASDPVVETSIDSSDVKAAVKLNLFPLVRHDSKTVHPIYFISQNNEAIYVKLDSRAVFAWLKTLDCDDMFELKEQEQIGAHLLAIAQPMKHFLREIASSNSPHTYFYLYTLLHSYSHLIMKSIAGYSGLDVSSMGEYIFPVDLAFIIYRNSTTMDLGNFSALWRNYGNKMLASILEQKSGQCSMGSLCLKRGSACPSCLMIPEISCITKNKLLSRSVLYSVGGTPFFDTRNRIELQGYLES